MNNPESPAQISDEKAVKAQYPNAVAHLFNGHWVTMKSPSDARHFTFGARTEAEAWEDARSRLEPVEAVSPKEKK